jgi:hypothetical protein
MSKEEVSAGLEIIEASARKFNLHLGSRHVDWFRGSIRLSLEKSVSITGRQFLRTPVVEMSREFVEDLPAQKEYQKALSNFLHSLSSRTIHPKPSQFLTLSGAPLDLEIHWPFRPVQDADSRFLHVLVRVGSPWMFEANFSILVWGTDRMQMGIPSLDAPTVESFVVNSIRIAVDRKEAKFYEVGRHPETLQKIDMSPSFSDRPTPDDAEVQNFIKKKVYWLGFREGDDMTPVSIVDPYDCSYLGRPAQRLKQIARVLSANQIIALDSSGQYANATDKLLRESKAYESGLNALLSECESPRDLTDQREIKTATPTRPSVFVSYSTEDAPFAVSLANALRARNLGVWLDQWEIQVGDSLIRRIGDALHSNNFIVVVLSPASVASDWIKLELAEAMTREIQEKRVIVLPVIARRCDIPAFLTNKKYADFTRDSDIAFEALVSAIEQHYGSYRA